MKTEIPTEDNEGSNNIQKAYSQIDLEDGDRSYVLSLIRNPAQFRTGVKKLLEYYYEK